MNESEHKVCKRCGQELPLSAFALKAGTKDGHQSYCRECMSKFNKERLAQLKAERQTGNAYVAPKETPKVHKVEEPKPIGSGLLQSFTAQQLVNDLRARGYEVSCKRVTIEEL